MAHPRPRLPDRQRQKEQQSSSSKERLLHICKSKTACQLLTLRTKIDCEKVDKAEKAVKDARKILEDLLERLQKKKRKTPRLSEGIKILEKLVKDENSARYFAIMNKESRLDNGAVSRSGAIGYFQLKPTSALIQDFSNYFGVTFTEQDLENPIYNCEAGIMYINLLQQHYVEKNPLFKSLSKTDKEFLAHAMYNAGPTLITDLWRYLKPASYADFEKKLSDILKKHLGTEQKKPVEQDDSTYGVRYIQYPGIDKYLSLSRNDPDGKLDMNITIGGNTLQLRKIGEILRYCRVIEAIQKCKKVKEAPKENQFILRKETYAENRKLWSMAEDLRKELVQQKFKGVSRGVTHGERMADRDFLIMALVRFNKEYNPDFPKQNGESNNIAIGIDILIPNIAYLEMTERDFRIEDIVNGERVVIRKKVEQQPETPLSKIPFYKNPELAQLGNRILTNKYKLDLETIEQGTNFSKKCKYKRTITHYIILHSTASEAPDRGFESTISDRGAHYVISRDGKIVAARDMEDNFDNAGRWENSRAKALWNGDEDVSAHSIGIEVATSPGEEWSVEQYKAVERLIHALGEKYKIQAKNILTHSQVACSIYGRGRKQDPMNLNWENLGLPNNYLLVDRDVLTGRIQPNFESIERDFAATDKQREHMIEGLRYSVALKKQFAKPLAEAKKQTEAEWRKQLEKRGFNTYPVKRKDSLYGIARKFGTSVDAIRVLNSLSSTDLQPEQKLKIPKRQR